MAAASSFAIAATALAAAGTVYSGVQTNKQAKAQASVMRQQAERERLQAAADSQEFRDAQQRLLAKRRAVMGASGIDATSGSPLLASEDFAGEAELEALKIRNGGDVRATRLDQQAGLTAAKGKADMAGSVFRGGSLLIDAYGSKWGEK